MDFKSLLKHLIVLGLLFVVILNVIAFVLVWRLDVFVHDDLYDFGLIINFDWANDYWFNAKLLWSFIAGTVVLTIIAIIPNWFHDQKSRKTAKILGFLLPTFAIICQAISIFALWQIDFIVKNRLFGFGVPTNFDWDVLYNPLSTTSMVLMVYALVILTISSVVIIVFSGKFFNLNPKVASVNLSAYLKTKNARWYWIILILVTVTVAIAYLVPENLYPLVYLRYVFGAMFIFWLPGYSFIRAIFIKRNRTKALNSLELVEKIGLVLCSNLAIVPITVLILNYTFGSIGLTVIIFGLLVITILFATLALILESQDDLFVA